MILAGGVVVAGEEVGGEILGGEGLVGGVDDVSIHLDAFHR